MDRRLLAQGLARFFGGVILMELALFLPAGSLRWRQGWLLTGVLYAPIIALRIRGEERLLERDLPGYAEYKRRVRHRVIPFLW